MRSLRYRASVAAVVLSSVVVSSASLSKHSFGASMIASAMSHFHNVKTAGSHPAVAVAEHPVTVATSTRIDDGKFTMDPPRPKVISGDGDADQGSGSGVQKNDKPIITPTKTGGDSSGQKPTTGGTGGNPSGTTGTAGPTGASGTADKGTAGNTGAGGTATQTVPPTTKPTLPVPNGFVTNLYQGMDIRDVLSDVASLAGVTIIPDESIKQQNVSIEFKNTPIAEAVEQLALYVGAYWMEDKPGVFLISKAAADSAMFPKFAETEMYHSKVQSAATIQLLLSASYKNYVSVDPKTNQIGVCAPKQLLQKIMADIRKADVPGKQVVVQALVTEMTVDDAMNSGFSFSGKNLSLGTDLGLNYQSGGFTDMAKLQAAITKNKATIRDSPRAMSMEGNESTISVGTDNYFSLLSGSTTFPTSQIQLIHTGVVLRYTAFVGDDGFITMILDPSVSDAVIVENGNPQNQVRTVSTKVRVKSGDSIVIGGLIQENTTRQIVRVPILGYIPIIGELFTQRNNDKKKIETIIAITPTIVPDEK